MGRKFPHRAVVLLALDSDGACTGLSGHCARETAVLVLVWCYKARGDREQDLLRYRLSENCIKQWCDQPSCCGCVSKKCEQGEQWSSDPAVFCVLSKLSDIQSENAYWLSWLITNHIDLVDSSVLPLLFLKSLCILSGCLIINIRSCHQDRKLSRVGPMEYHPHTGCHNSKLLTYLCHDYNSFSNISGMDLCVGGYRHVRKWFRC